MFYEASELDCLLVCKICDQKLQDPRVLPCGHTFCNRCIEAVAETDKIRIKCNNCAKTHEIPLEGFPENSTLNQIIRLKSNEVFRGLLVKDFKRICETIREKTEKLESDLVIGATLIRNHCDKARNDAQLTIEEAHVKLEEIKKEFLDEIDEYERACQEQFKQIQQNKTEIDKILTESKDFLNKSDALHKQFDINEKDIKARQNEANMVLENLETVEEKFYSNMFKGVNFKFEKNVEGLVSNYLGYLKRQNIDLHYLENVSTINEIGLTNKFNDFDVTTQLRCIPFQNRHFICAYINKNKNFNIALIDNETNIRIERKNVITCPKFQHIIGGCVGAYSSNHIIYVLSMEKFSDKENPDLIARSFDENLNLISTLKLDFIKAFLYSFDGLLYLGRIKEEDDCSEFDHLTSYNSKFDVIQKLERQEDENLPFYFPISTFNVLINDQFYMISHIVKEDTEDEEDEDEDEEDEDEDQLKITIINKTNGKVENSFDVYSFDYWALYLNKYILAWSYENENFCCYDFKGNLIDLDSKLNESHYTKQFKVFPFKKEIYFYYV